MLELNKFMLLKETLGNNSVGCGDCKGTTLGENLGNTYWSSFYRVAHSATIITPFTLTSLISIPVHEVTSIPFMLR